MCSGHLYWCMAHWWHGEPQAPSVLTVIINSRLTPCDDLAMTFNIGHVLRIIHEESSNPLPAIPECGYQHRSHLVTVLESGRDDKESSMKPWPSEPVERARRRRLPHKPALEIPRTAPAGERSALARRLRHATGLVAAVGLFASCFPPEEERLSCDDVYAQGSFDYRVMEELILQDEVRTSKGCLGAPCHSAATQRGGVRLDTPELIYDELSTRPDVYYEALASGYMPHDGIPWDDEELKVFRSWYCAGAFPP